MTTTIPTKIGKRAGALTKQREVACPTCHAPIGAFCVSVGQHGAIAGNIMATSCHNARIIAAGLTPRSPNRKPKSAASASAKGSRNQRISRALKLSWAKRKAEEAEAAPHKAGRAKQAKPQSYKSVVEGQVNNIDLSKLIQSALATLEVGADNVLLSLEGVGSVSGRKLDAIDTYNLVVKKG